MKVTTMQRITWVEIGNGLKKTVICVSGYEVRRLNGKTLPGVKLSAVFLDVVFPVPNIDDHVVLGANLKLGKIIYQF